MTIVSGIYKKYQTNDECGLDDLLETCENHAINIESYKCEDLTFYI